MSERVFSMKELFSYIAFVLMIPQQCLRKQLLTVEYESQPCMKVNVVKLFQEGPFSVVPLGATENRKSVFIRPPQGD